MVEELDYTEPSQGWAWNSRVFSACRTSRLNPCNDLDLRTFFSKAAVAACRAGAPAGGADHYGNYLLSLDRYRLARREREQRHLPLPQPDIPPHVRWYADTVLRPTQRASFLMRLLDTVSLMMPAPNVALYG